MPTLTIDHKTVTVPEGSNVLEAAIELGIVVPHFCYHKALGAVGACRLCAMHFEEGPVTGTQIACMVKATDGMVIFTDEEKAMAFRAQVIEWMMMNHPHDCPVCDEGGECQLQDMVVAGGHGIRKFTGKKRTYQNQQLGPFVEQEMNRCIQCYRCVRTYQGYCGGDDFGVMGSRQRLFFGRFKDGPLESPFAGNIIDMCPTGVFTSKPFRYKSRLWDLEESHSICPHCSLGCTTIPGGSYRELQRVRSGQNPKVNDGFLCDRGRFGYGYVNHIDRIRKPQIGHEEAEWADALYEMRRRLEAIHARHGDGSIAACGGERSSMESIYLLKTLVGEYGGCYVSNIHGRRQQTARVVTDRGAVDLADLRSSDFVLILGADPMAEAPLAALAIRQAARAGAPVKVIDPRPVDLPNQFDHLPIAADMIAEAMLYLYGEQVEFTGAEKTFLDQVKEALQGAKRPVIVAGGDLLGPEGMQAVYWLQSLRAKSGMAAVYQEDLPENSIGVFPLLSAPNSYGAALMADGDPEQLLDDIRTGKVKALISLESDPFAKHPDQERVQSTLTNLDLFCQISAIPGRGSRWADIVLPASMIPETDGLMVNNSGRMQAYAQTIEPGVPIREETGGGHPLRDPSLKPAGTEPRPSWQIVAELLDRPLDLDNIRQELTSSLHGDIDLDECAPGGEGVRLQPRLEDKMIPFMAGRIDAELQLLVAEEFQGSEVYSSSSLWLKEVIPAPKVIISSELARQKGISSGDQATIFWHGGDIDLKVEVSDPMSDTTVVITRIRGSVTDSMVPGGGVIPCSLEKSEVGR